MEIVQERLEREYNLNLITTAPSVVYKVVKKDGNRAVGGQSGEAAGGRRDREVDGTGAARAHLRAQRVRRVRAPALPGPPGLQKDIKYIGTKRVQITYEIPSPSGVRLLRQAEEHLPGLRLARLRAPRIPEADLVKLDILINGEPVDALSTIVHRERAYSAGEPSARS